MKTNLLLLFCLLTYLNTFAQSEQNLDNMTRKERLIKDPLTPAKAAFYSAIFPGAGQFYTRRYWTIPIFYVGMGVSAYTFNFQKNQMNLYRDAYKQRIKGVYSDEFVSRITQNSQLIEGMEYHKKYRDLSVLWFAGFYLLNVLDANVGAHLMQFNVDDNLSFKTFFDQNNINQDPAMGIALQLKF